MYKLWLLTKPGETLVAIFILQVALGLLIHALLLTTTDLNWWEDGRPIPFPEAAAYERSQAGLGY
ncbi:Antenna complex alpha/beta subunit [Thioflavicoccus mobilis 8321]|uniref:Antenna complex alpha/beta subunit n=1 Tax=Thioflavicoccus mobilis 8321 TaxID=765912 RepID=L0H202_9GAMM|nr:light-harvesting antenna LH1, alpha subunit [Thioflavicoccus mobilis]AGA91680.1 Antenna complex alpha/beta subunit [Thioflavicoccus mobilis 8321]